MIEAGTSPANASPVESALREELAMGDALLGTIEPILGHLLANHDHSLFSDEIVSRVRGMAADLAHQLLLAHARNAGQGDPHRFADHHTSALASRLIGQGALISHCHALAVEAQLAGRFETRQGMDPVLSPLLQALVASDDAPVASLAMSVLTAQARFIQRQRRMELALADLPADLFHRATQVLVEFAGDTALEGAAATAATLRDSYDESASRPGLLERLVHEMGGGARAALSVGHAGVAIFLSALAAISKQPRDLVVISTNDQQAARLALALRAAGLKATEVEQQFAYFNPETPLPEDFGMLRIDRAETLLAESDCAGRR